MQHSSGYVKNIVCYIDEVKENKNLDFGLGKREWNELKEKLK